MKKIILTGDRPTGSLHLGHYIGSLKNRVQLQNDYEQYIMIADIQALTDNFENPSKVTNNVYEIALGYFSVGIDHTKTKIFIQSQIPELTELTSYYMNLVTVNRLERNPTVKAEIQQKSYNDSIPAGFFCYPVSQAADITAFKAELVPVGDDQIPMIEQTNEIVRKFNRIYKGNFLKECQPFLSKTSRLVGIDGKGKASKSLGNAIMLNDSPDQIKKKIFDMYTDSNHIKVSDPGQIEGNVVFAYLDAFFEDKNEVEELKKHYKKGGLGDVVIKNKLNNCLQNMLLPIREARNALKIDQIKEILYEGTQQARIKATQTLEEVRNAIGIKYW